MLFSFHLYDMPEYVRLMHVLFWGRRDFSISFSKTCHGAFCHGENYMVDTGILSNNMKYPSLECSIVLWCFTICSDILNRSDIIYRVMTSLPTFDLLLISESFQQSICDRCGIRAGHAYSSGHLVSFCSGHQVIYLLRPGFRKLFVFIRILNIALYFYFNSNAAYINHFYIV